MKLFISFLIVLKLSFAASADDPLPRVLILGDSVYNEPARSAAAELKGRVEVVIPKAKPGDSATTLTRLDQLLVESKWHVIHFNFGFADLHYRDPSTKTIRAMSKHAGGVRVTTPEQYEKNLHELVQRLKATGAKLIWASTTPITSSKYDNIFDPGSEVEYNAIAAKVMAQHKVPINDMHVFVLENSEKKKDPSPFGFKGLPLHPPIVRSILAELNMAKGAAD